MLSRFLPWKFLIKRAAHKYGIIDPATVLAKVRRFSQPSEVQEPIELLRAGIIFQARGLINTRAIQYNLDWIWPYWVERQFNPHDPSFLPRAFSATHINLTQRNWSAVGQPNLPIYPIVDPRGLLTPLYDGWSLDFWIIPSRGEPLLPSKLSDVEQKYLFDPNLTVQTKSKIGDTKLETNIDLIMNHNEPEVRVKIKSQTGPGGRLCVSVRPYNTEGIQFIETISYDSAGPCFLVDHRTEIHFDTPPSQLAFSNYDHGDVFNELHETKSEEEILCRVGMATAAALFPLEPGEELELEIRVPLGEELKREFPKADTSRTSWPNVRNGTADLNVPDANIKYIYDCAVHTLILLSAYDMFPGPYVYRRFWFRDACLMLNALMSIGHLERAKTIIDKFPERQKKNGYFLSQEGEWDSNGHVLWIMDRFQSLAGYDIPSRWLNSLIKGADWIIGKRMTDTGSERLDGLLPAGFSAEHLGPNDYYYWDDFWSVAGLKAAGRLTERAAMHGKNRTFMAEAEDFLETIFRSIKAIPENVTDGAIPAAPFRRMDAGAIGSMVADWPLKITGPNDLRISKTLDYLLENCFHRGGFFQNMIHSGINIYLTLALAQTLLRNKDDRYQELLEASAEFASPTGQWPEAIHPFSGGGCMGDGQHGWAAAEWVLMIRNLFVREEEGVLIIGSGILPRWIELGEPISFGPTPTPFGPVSVFLKRDGDQWILNLEAYWRNQVPQVLIMVQGFESMELPTRGGSLTHRLTKK
jgi:hypothetical protein